MVAAIDDQPVDLTDHVGPTNDLCEAALEAFQPRPSKTMPAPDYAGDPTMVRQSSRY